MAKSQEDDIREIRRRAAAVGEVNQGLDVETTRECFAPDYLMWNLNSHIMAADS